MVLGLKEGLVECATVCVKSVVILILVQCTEVRFTSSISSGFTTMVVINPLDWKLANIQDIYLGLGLELEFGLERIRYLALECP